MTGPILLLGLVVGGKIHMSAIRPVDRDDLIPPTTSLYLMTILSGVHSTPTHCYGGREGYGGSEGSPLSFAEWKIRMEVGISTYVYLRILMYTYV